MEKIAALTGWLWVKEGFSLFRKQPGELTTLVLCYLFLMLGFNLVPYVGEIIWMTLVPVFSVGFMQASIDIEQGRRVYPKALFTGFHTASLKTLLKLGVLYFLALLVAIAVLSMVDGGLLMKIASGEVKVDQKLIEESSLPLAILVATVVYIPFGMALWFAAPLIAWKNMRLGKAIFYSFLTIFRHGKTFVVFALSWLLVEFAGIIFANILSMPIAAFISRESAAALVAPPLYMIFTAAFNCSFYRSYVQMFGPVEVSSEPQ